METFEAIKTPTPRDAIASKNSNETSRKKLDELLFVFGVREKCVLRLYHCDSGVGLDITCCNVS